MDEAAIWARSKGATAMQLGVWAFNDAALALYQELGYVTQQRVMMRSLDD